MDQALRRAAKRGDINALDSLLIQEPDALEKATLSPSADTPLHVATQAGKTLFVKKIIELKPGFAWDRNRDGLTPLHLASALGHEEIVDVLLDVGSSGLCWIRDSGKRIPLHYAAINGKVRVIEKLLRCCPKSLEARTNREETCLHLALINKQVAALEKLLQGVGENRALLDAKNDFGYCIYELAVFTNQSQVLSSLTKKWDTSYMWLKYHGSRALNPKFPGDPELLIVVASIIVTLTFQAVANPPSSIWKQGQKLDYRCLEAESKMAFRFSKYFAKEDNAKWNPELCPSPLFTSFMAFNSSAFLFSVMFITLFKRGGGLHGLLYASLLMLMLSYMVLVDAMDHSNASLLWACFWGECVLIPRLIRWQKERNAKINRARTSTQLTRVYASEGTGPTQV